MSIDNNDSVTMPALAAEPAATPPLEPAAHPLETSPALAMQAPEAPPKATVVVDESLGLRLRAAREAKGLTPEAAAQKLKLPVVVLQSLEAERFERIGHAIYLRGYLTKYLQLLDLPQVLAERVLQERAAPQPPLVTSGTVSRPRYLFERYSGSALYLILTGVIVVPAVLLAMRAGFDQNLVRVTPLDTPEIIAPLPVAKLSDEVAAPAPKQTPAEESPKPAAPPHDTPSAPLIASMTPFPASAAPAETAAKPAAVASAPGEHQLRLTLAEASWVEIVAADGQKLEYGLLAAGSTHSYASAKSLDVRIGNANGATLEIDGRARDLAPYRHANVAHVKLADGEITALHSGG